MFLSEYPWRLLVCPYPDTTTLRPVQLLKRPFTKYNNQSPARNPTATEAPTEDRLGGGGLRLRLRLEDTSFGGCRMLNNKQFIKTLNIDIGKEIQRDRKLSEIKHKTHLCTLTHTKHTHRQTHGENHTRYIYSLILINYDIFH